MKANEIAKTSLAVAALLGVWWLDLRTGIELSLDLLYLLPILALAYSASLPATLITAAFAALLSFRVDLAEHPAVHNAIQVWNGFGSWLIFSSFGALIHALFQERQRRQRTIQRLEGMLSAEARRAKLDRLTGLANTRSFLTALQQTLERADAHDESVCLAILNLENFARLNQCYGYEACSTLLIDLSVGLTDIFGSPCTLARIGSSKFAVLFPDGQLAQANLLGLGCAGSVQKLSARYPDAQLGMSVGIVRSAPGQDPQELLGIGDAIAHEAKEKGGAFHCLIKDLGRPGAPVGLVA